MLKSLLSPTYGRNVELAEGQRSPVDGPYQHGSGSAPEASGNGGPGSPEKGPVLDEAVKGQIGDLIDGLSPLALDELMSQLQAKLDRKYRSEERAGGVSNPESADFKFDFQESGNSVSRALERDFAHDGRAMAPRRSY